MKFPILFRMRGAARTQKERCCERPLERIPYLKLDCYSMASCLRSENGGHFAPLKVIQNYRSRGGAGLATQAGRDPSLFLPRRSSG